MARSSLEDMDSMIHATRRMSKEIAHSQLLLKKRTSAKIWLSRTKNNLMVECDAESPDEIAIKEMLHDLEIRLQTFDDLESEYESTLDLEEIDKCVADTMEYRMSIMEARVRAIGVLKGLSPPPPDVSTPIATPVEQVRSRLGFDGPTLNVKLPKLSIPKFSGDMLMWQSFWDMFRANIHDTPLPLVSKFTYLMSLLEGEAQEVIAGLSITDANYGSAILLLQARYGRPDTVMFKHIQDMVNLVVGTHPTHTHGIRRLYDRLMMHVRSLKCMGIEESQYGVLLTPIILSCLPTEYRVQWGRESSGKESDLIWLLRFLEQEIQLRETAQVFQMTKPSVEEKKSRLGSPPRSASPPVSSVALLQSCSQGSGKKSCQACKGEHTLFFCPSFDSMKLSDKYKLLRRYRLCFRCFRSGHRMPECKRSGCEICCSPNHHMLLHPDTQTVPEV